MIYLPSQTAFSDLIALKMRGGSAVLDAPYEELYGECETQNSANWYMLSAEERTEKLVDFVENARKTQVDNLIQKQTLSGAEKDALHKLNLKGQVLLASTDGRNFNQILTKNNLPASTSGLTLLSPSLRSATTDYHEVINEQASLNKVADLESQGYLVKNPPRIESDRIIVDVIDPKAGEAEVKFDVDSLDLIPSEPVEAGHVYGSQLPGEYGQAKIDPTLIPVTEEEILRAAITQDTNSGEKNKKIAIAAAGAAMMANLLGIKKMGAALAADRALRDMKSAKVAMQYPLAPRLGGESGHLTVTNTAAKAATEARVGNYEKKIRESQENDAKREAQCKEDQRKKDDQDRKLALQRKQMASSGGGTSSGGMGGAAIGAGIGAAVAAAGFAGTSLYIALQNNNIFLS
jgi:hypothetical protein